MVVVVEQALEKEGSPKHQGKRAQQRQKRSYNFLSNSREVGRLTRHMATALSSTMRGVGIPGGQSTAPDQRGGYLSYFCSVASGEPTFLEGGSLPRI